MRSLQSGSLCLLSACEFGPSDSSVPHLSPTALSRDPPPRLSLLGRGEKPQTRPHNPLLPLNTSSTSMATCRGGGGLPTERILLLAGSPSPLSSAGTCNYLMPGRQVLSRGVRTGASWQPGMIRRNSGVLSLVSVVLPTAAGTPCCHSNNSGS